MTATDPLKHLTKLSHPETGNAVWVELSNVILIERMAELQSMGKVYPERTRLLLAGDPGVSLLVSETPNEIEQIVKEGLTNDDN